MTNYKVELNRIGCNVFGLSELFEPNLHAAALKLNVKGVVLERLCAEKNQTSPRSKISERS